jgi:hypothetical protein
MKKHEFRKGDRVICVDNFCAENRLTLNHIYVVVKCDTYKAKTSLVGIKEEFFSERFILTEKRIAEYL